MDNDEPEPNAKVGSREADDEMPRVGRHDDEDEDDDDDDEEEEEEEEDESSGA